MPRIGEGTVAGAAVQLPFNVEAEQALLGALMLSNAALHAVSGFLKAEHFMDPAHGRIYTAIGAMTREGVAANPITLKHAFENDGDLDAVGGARYLALLVREATTVINAPGYARIVHDTAVRRDALVLMGEADAELRNFAGLDAAHILERHAMGVSGVLADCRTQQKLSVQNVAQSAAKVIATYHEPEGEGAPRFGLTSLDELMGGLYTSEFTVIAGRPGMGKTTAGTHLARAAAEQGHGVLYFSLEMSRRRLTERILADLSFTPGDPIYYQDIRRRRLSTHQLESLSMAAQRLEGLALVLDDEARQSMPMIRAKCLQYRDQLPDTDRPLGLVIIDHMGHIRDSQRFRNKIEATAEISGELLQLAKDLKVPVTALHQLSRAVEQRDDKRPTLSDLRWAGEVEQDADNVIFVHRPEYYLRQKKPPMGAGDGEWADWNDALDKIKNRIEWILAKQRSGETGTITTYCDVGASAIRSLPVDGAS